MTEQARRIPAPMARPRPRGLSPATRRRIGAVVTHGILLLGLFIVFFPIYVTFIGSTLTLREIVGDALPLLPGDQFVENYGHALVRGLGLSGSTPVWFMMWNSLVMAMIIAVGKIVISLLSAFAIIYFRFPFRSFFFWLIFITLMLPVEVRIVPTVEVVSDLGMFDTYAGLTVPLIASATATFLFRQFFMTVPDELTEAARIDGAGPLRFFWDILLPLSRTNIAALFVILFIYGWNQYLWPLIISDDLETVVIGISNMMAVEDGQQDWPVIMATTILAMIPPVLVVVLMQRWFVKGLIETEK